MVNTSATLRHTPNLKQQAASSKQQAASSKQQAASSKQQAASELFCKFLLCQSL
jgi:hypothetical protein